MTKNQISFKEAFERLKEIEEILEQDEIIDIDNLIELQKEAKNLHKIAENKLKSIENKD